MKINQHVLMSGAEYFSDQFAINAHMDSQIPVSIDKAQRELADIKRALEAAGVKVTQVAAPINCQDGVYTANWAFCRGGTAVMSRLPNKRKGEEPYAAEVLRSMGNKIVSVPDELRFSGQGDACPRQLFIRRFNVPDRCGCSRFFGFNFRV